MATTQDLRTTLEEYQKSAEGYRSQLCLDLANIIVFGLRQRGWTQKQLAGAAKLSQPQLTRIIHARENCTFGTAGRIFHALGIDREQIKFKASPPHDWELEAAKGQQNMPMMTLTEDAHNGAQKTKEIFAVNGTVVFHIGHR